MSIWQLWHGGGKRRKSDENWDDLQRQLSDAQERAKKVKGAVFYQCPTRDHGAYWVYAQGVECPWCTIARLRGQVELLTTRPAPRPDGIAVTAPADTPRIGRPVDEPVADPNAETQAVDVRDLKAVMGLGDTVVIPPIPDRSPIADPVGAEIEARLNIPGPPPFASATSIPVAAVKNAVSSVEAVLSEAS